MIKDYSGSNLCGRSFRGQDLTGAIFTQSSIRGADFTKSILKNTDFSCAKCGLQKRWAGLLFLALLLLSGLSGIISGVGGYLATYLLMPGKNIDFSNFPSAIATLIASLIFLITTVYKGFEIGLGAGIFVLIPTLILSVFFRGSIAAIGLAFFFWGGSRGCNRN